ncbi:MAG TPA: hypothetical protein VFE32_13780 [Puia sp.]|jgi:hypothetical protein|nr:hypothetical protein [Puia sp.]
MNNPFQHYYLFIEGGTNSNFLTLAYKQGHYRHLEDGQNPMTKFVMTISQPLFVIKKPDLDCQIINPFASKWLALTQYNNCQDTIVIIGDPALRTIEFFVSEKTKEHAVLIYELVKSKQLDAHIKYFQELAGSYINRR